MKVSILQAREHNLKGIDVEFGNGLTVVTGVSGSGKTSLVFDTLYHESRRRFLEIFSLGASAMRLAPARVELISGLGPAVAVGQNLLNRNPSSTLASASGLHPFFRILYTNSSERGCANCGEKLSIYSKDAVIERLQGLTRTSGETVVVYAPLVRRAFGSHRTLLDLLTRQFGAPVLRVDGVTGIYDSSNPDQPHTIEIEIARFEGEVTPHAAREAVDRAASLGISALVLARSSDSGSMMDEIYSLASVCFNCGTWFNELRSAHFMAACPFCSGKGCGKCAGTGMHPEAAAARWQGMRLPDLLEHSVHDLQRLFDQTTATALPSRLKVEILRRLEALEEVGLGYISLDRSSPTLSRGEAQRVRLAVALTSRLEDMLHVLDEPTVGQHPADVARLLPVFRKLGGPVVFVEHDRLAAAFADHAIDLGPGAGQAGGELIFQGTPAELWQAETPTGRWFSHRQRVPDSPSLPVPREFLIVRGAGLRNLRGIDVPIPLNRLTVISGVSGSGKSTLVEDVLVASLSEGKPLGCTRLEGQKLKPIFVDQSPIGINPRSNPATYTGLADILRDLFSAATGLSPSHFSFNRDVGACPTCKGMGAIEVQMRYLPSAWIPCEDCEGKRFSDEVLSAQAAFAGQTMNIAQFFEASVAEIYPLLANDVRLTETNRKSAQTILQALLDVGLGYLPLGQPSPSLSGGEAQRVKLARSLGKRSLAGQLLILDEPSTGLHPQDVAGLIAVLHRLRLNGATLVVVEHNSDILQAADWIIDLGPGAGPEGGRLLYAGPPEGLLRVTGSQTAQALIAEADLRPSVLPGLQPDHVAPVIEVRGARANNLQNVTVRFPKSALTVVTGVSGSGKSSLVGDVLETEARRRYLESLSMYERQSTREGPEAPVDAVNGLGVAVTITAERSAYRRRATLGTATELDHLLAVLLADLGERKCLDCGSKMQRGHVWTCPQCGGSAPVAEPRHFNPTVYAAACRKCNGVGTLQHPVPEKLIVHPEKPLCAGAMYSPGFFPQGYLCKPFNGGYDMVQALAARYHFDPFQTPWNDMTLQAQQAFLFGDPEPMTVNFRSRTGREHTGVHHFPGFYGWIGDWDVGGTYSEARPCPSCQGGGLRPEYSAVSLAGANWNVLSEMPLVRLADIIEQVSHTVTLEVLQRGLHFTASSLETAQRRLRFLMRTGLGYLNLQRHTATLSAGEAQRIRLAGLLGSEMTSLTVLLDEPSRGLHSSEVQALIEALRELSQTGNTVIVVEHDLEIMRAADYLVDMGPGAGKAGGRVMAQGSLTEVMQSDSLTARWLRGECSWRSLTGLQQVNFPEHWMVIHGARANNLRGDVIRFPLNRLVGVCGVSGSGKSTLVIDTLGRLLAPRKQTTSVAYEPVQPGIHDRIEGAPNRAIIVDQARQGVRSPADFLDLTDPLLRLFAESDSAVALGLDESAFHRHCSACGGSGVVRTEMGFLPDVFSACDLCAGTGFQAEAWEVAIKGVTLPDLFALTIDEVYDLFGSEENLARPLQAARQVGLGYLALRQPGYALSGGEAQRLKIAHELCRKAPGETLYILDEPTVGQHAEDVSRLVGVLRGLVQAGHSVLVVEHHPLLLACCDWLVELGPGGGPEGGWLVAEGMPREVAAGSSPSAPYLREILEEGL